MNEDYGYVVKVKNEVLPVELAGMKALPNAEALKSYIKEISKMEIKED